MRGGEDQSYYNVTSSSVSDVILTSASGAAPRPPPIRDCGASPLTAACVPVLPDPKPGPMVISVPTIVPLESVVQVPVNESELVPRVTVVSRIVPSEPRVSVWVKLSLGDSMDELSLEPDPELSPLDAPLLAPDESMLN